MAELDDVLKTLTVASDQPFRRQKVRLHVASGNDVGRHHDFEGRARIGSRPLADFVIKDAKVSGLHCEISLGETLRVRDLGSKNGTFLGGYRVFDAVVPAGQVVALGDTRVRVVPRDELVEVPLHPRTEFHGLVGRSHAMRALVASVERLAASDATVLIQGETGTGKELVAEALHSAGPHAAGPLVIVDCGSVPAGLIEAELFGYEKGAFTGAEARTPGAFERAHGGTLFLDEVGELPYEQQPKLLRALESREVRRLGGDRRIPTKVRVVAATNRDLALEVTRGRFREDLYYRLAVVSVSMPPLRERLDDLPLLAVHILRELGVEPASCLTLEALAALANHDWPGNVRELRNTLHRAAALLEPVELPPKAASDRPDVTVPLSQARQLALDRLEREYVTTLLDQCAGNVSEVARRAGIDRMAIYRILQRLGMRGGRRGDS
jgi:DNA-binding NtrC family response regulator